MKILRGRVHWYHGFHNRPGLEFLVDKIPDHNDLRYERRGNLYYAELDGYVDFYSAGGDGQGYGGRRFDLKMKDGTEEVLRGPYSSSSSSMNAAGFGPCIEAALTTDADGFETNRVTFRGCSLLVSLVRDNLNLVELEDSYTAPQVGYHDFYGKPCSYYKPPLVLQEFPPGSSVVVLDPTEDASGVGSLSAEQEMAFGGNLKSFHEIAVRFPDGTIWTKPNRGRV